MPAEPQSARIDDQLAKLHPFWLNWLRLRHRSLKHLHADLVQDALADLLRYLSLHNEQHHSDEDVRRVGFAILRRRVADAFRASVVQWAEDHALDELPNTDPSHDLDKVVAYRKVLRTVTAMMAKLDDESRALLLGAEADGRADDAPLSAAERQRLSRLRAALRRRLKDESGVDIRQFLGE